MVQLGGENGTITGLSSLGTDLGGFMTNVTPGIIALVFGLGIAGAIIGIIYALVVVMKRKMNSVK